MTKEDKKEIKITKEEMKKYEACRQNGITNMFDIKRVEELTGLSKEKILYIMKHYLELIEKYNISKYDD